MASNSINCPSIPCVKCADGNGSFFRLENTQLAGYCSDCFVRVVRQKFASCFGRNRLFKEQSQRNVLLVYTPGHPESEQLLRFTHQAVCEPSDHRRLRINAQILVLLEDLPTNLAVAFQKLPRQFHPSWKWHFAHTAAVFNPIGSDECKCAEFGGFHGEENLPKHTALLENCRSSSVRAELDRLLRHQLIARLAAHLQCQTVLLPDCADQLAEATLNALCFGRGPSIADLSAVADDRFLNRPLFDCPIQFVRPLRDISRRELEAMQRVNMQNGDGAVENGDQLGNLGTNGGDVQMLTGQFINTLRDNGFPATVSTILSVAAKVEGDREGSTCALCFASFQPQPTTEEAKLCTPCQELVEEIEDGRNLLLDIFK